MNDNTELAHWVALLDQATAKGAIDRQRMIDAARTWCTDRGISNESEIMRFAATTARDIIAKRITGGDQIADIYYRHTVKTTNSHCPKCVGSGQYRYSDGNIGTCFKCDGTGKKPKSGAR